MSRLVAVTLLALALTAIAIRFWPRPPLALSIASSTAVVDARGRLLRMTLARDEQYRLWTPMDAVAPQFVEALLLHEDRHFYHHLGINPLALVRAGAATYGGGTRRGGSTLTMQLARLMYRLNTRHVAASSSDGARVLLELRYSKRELLEAHINLMPYGGNVQGVGAASLIYFNKSRRICRSKKR